MIHSFPTRRSSDLERGQEIFSSKVEGRPVIGVQEADLETFGILRLGGEAGNVAPDLLLGNEAVVAAYMEIDLRTMRLNATPKRVEPLISRRKPAGWLGRRNPKAAYAFIQQPCQLCHHLIETISPPNGPRPHPTG